jgi:hypothetical protein
MIYISRGASAALNFDFSSKVYRFQDIDQITFIFRQNKNIYWYKMFTYLVPSMDAEAVSGKTYYTKVTPIEEDTYQCTAEEVLEPVSPEANGYYEEAEGNHSWRDTYYLVDPAFSQNSGPGWDYISLLLSPSDTLEFKPTFEGQEIEYEVAIRLNTDSFATLGNKDSIIIEPQHPIAVVDTLYSKLI